MTTTDSHLDPHLRERYGARRTGRRTWIVAAVVLGALGLGWLAWVALFYSTPAASSDLVAWEVVDDRSVTAQVSVARSDADVEATCLLRAQAAPQRWPSRQSPTSRRASGRSRGSRKR